MRIRRNVTHLGRGYWGGSDEACDLALLSEKRVYRDSLGLREETVTKYLLAVRAGEGDSWDFRIFDSLKERQAHIDSRLDAYSLHGPVPDPDPALARAYHPAMDLIESRPRVVSLLGGRLTMEFDAGRLEVYRWPTCVDRGVVRDPGRPGYREAVCRLIERCVTDVDECLDTGLEFRFIGGMALHVDLDGRRWGQRPVVATFRTWHGPVYRWNPGEIPFAARRALDASGVE